MDNGISIVHFFTCIQQKLEKTNSKASKKQQIEI